MSNLFEEFHNDEAYYYQADDVETYEQQYLRVRFASLTERNRLEIVCFDPYQHPHKQIELTVHEAALRQKESELEKIYQAQMLKTIGLEPPTELDDPRTIVDYAFKNGTREVIFTIDRNDGMFVPVFYQTKYDGSSLRMMHLLSFDKAQEAVLFYRDLDEYRSKLSEKLLIPDQKLTQFSLNELKAFHATFEDIENLEQVNN